MPATHITKADFLRDVFDFENNQEWAYAGDEPCIIDFWAPWCGPCRMVGPILDEIADSYEGKLKVYKVNTEEEQELAGAFGIRSIPSILFVPKEGRPQMAVGALPKSSFQEAIKDIFNIEA
ncbi:thioredoxin [Myxococcota bacterium]|nr:thioredoxin [Myxococcota bacterium]MBU1429328.1 thioredoxin [Myxococcota bacterium]MBU1896596.1 thioredoxin [Myxococcota bacterium]